MKWMGNYRKRFEIVFLLLGLTMTSCSGSKERAGSANLPGAPSTVSPGTTAKAPSRLCSLFTNAEITEILGAPVGTEGWRDQWIPPASGTVTALAAKTGCTLKSN
jgi:hypothetical protein